MEQWYLYKKKANFNQIGEKFNIDPVIARLIRNRDVVGDEQIQQYLYGELSDISDPFLMKGVKEGVEILKQKVQEGKTIRIISDYDVCASTTMNYPNFWIPPMNGFARAPEL